MKTLLMLAKIVLVLIIVMWVYGIFYYEPVTQIVQDNCTMNGQVNQCMVLSTNGIR